MDSRPRIIPVVYTAPGIYGDFNAMLADSRYDDSLFLFNDNAVDHPTARMGGGNAVIRPYNKYGTFSAYPRSAGIPTGYSRSSGGYSALTISAQESIDGAIDEIEELLKLHKYHRIFFSAEPANGEFQKPQLATSIFKIGPDVRNYITAAIYSLGS